MRNKPAADPASHEAVRDAYNRFMANYLSLAAQPDLDWFEANIGPVLQALGHKIPGQAQDHCPGPKISEDEDDFEPEFFVDRFDYKLLGWSRPVETS